MRKSGNIKGDLAAAADFGSSAVRVLVAESLGDGAMRLLGVGETESEGVREGRVVDIEKAVSSLKRAVQEAELMSGCGITSAWAAVSGEHILGVNASGTTVVGDPGSVAMSDVNKVKQMAQAEVAGRSGMKVIATLEREYELDGHKGIEKPAGMSGHKLSGDMHLVLASTNALSDWEKCMLECGVEIEEQFIFAGLAAARAVLTEDEKNLGVCVVDIGASTTDVAVFIKGRVAGAFSFAVASGDVHRDVAHVHHASLASAEKAKKTVGLSGADGEFVSLLEAGGGEGKLSLPVVRDTIAHRVDEILEMADDGLKKSVAPEERLSGGVVLCGDGALLPGLAETATAKLGMPARIGRPRYRGEMHERTSAPRFAVGMGLLDMAAEMGAMRGGRKGMFQRIREMFGGAGSSGRNLNQPSGDHHDH